MENFFEKEQTNFGTAGKFDANQVNFIAKDPKHGGSSCDYWYELIDNLNENYDCADYEDRFDELQERMDLHAGYYGCAFELCGLTAGHEHAVNNAAVINSTFAAPLFLTFLFWLMK